MAGEGSEATEEIYARARARASGEQFRSVHPEVCGSQENAKKIANWCEERGFTPTFENLERALTALMEAGELDLVPEEEAATPRAERKLRGPKPTASDIAAGYPSLSDREFMRVVDYDLSSDQFRKRWCLNSDWFRNRVEALFTAPPVFDGVNPRR